MVKGFTRKYAPLEIISDDHVKDIQNGTKEVLETTGVRVEHNKALEIFDGHGCSVDKKNNRVRIPAWLVEECLRKTPSSFVIKLLPPRP